MLDYHLQKLFVKESYQKDLSLLELSKELEVDRQQLLKQIQLVNLFLRAKKQEEITVIKEVIRMPEKINFSWPELKYSLAKSEMIYSEQERQSLIYLYCFLECENISVFHFQDFLQVSKNTILTDIKRLRKALDKKKIALEYNRKTGFFLAGEELAIRVTAKNYVSELLNSSFGEWGLIELQMKIPTQEYLSLRKNLKQSLKSSAFNIVPSRIEETAHFIVLLSYRALRHSILLKPKQRKILKGLSVVESVDEFIAYQPQFQRVDERLFLTSLFLIVIEGEMKDLALNYLFECSAQIIDRMERISAINLKDENQTLLHTYYHLVPSFFRIYFGYELPNVWTDTIKRQHKELFELTEIALEPLEALTGKNIPDDEIAYFTILFSGEIERQKEKQRVNIRALILCPNGISSSLIMQAELKKLFPIIDFSLTNSIKELQSIPESRYDVIFSNVAVITNKPCYLVQPIMTNMEKQRLLMTVQEQLVLPGIAILSPKQIIETLEPYIELKKGVEKETLLQILTNKMSRKNKYKEDLRPMLSELITQDTIQIVDEPLKWQEAITLVARPLLEQGKIESRYIDAMINKVKEFGAFIHIGKSIALPHARPEDGVNELGMSLLKTNKPVLLLDDEKHPVTIFICLAAVDNAAHLRALASLTKILSNSENLERLIQASTKEEIQTILKGEDEQ